MNLVSGGLMSHEQSLPYLDRLSELVCRTHEGEALSAQRVISACDTLSQGLDESQHLPLLLALGMEESRARDELAMVKQMMSREYLQNRLEIEFGGRETTFEFVPFGNAHAVKQEWKPMGVLLHIAAGNVDALPAFSVIEGLLTGNINILKLPGTDDGLSIAILQELIRIEPLIADYVYVFDYPSEDIESIRKMAAVANAIVVWGGDAAVTAVRNMATPNTRIIEWGHKISFAYVSGAHVSDEALEGIAYNICDTNQLFCNSCQGIYLDTDDYGDIVRFADRFIAVLERISQTMPQRSDPYLHAQKTLELYVEELEARRTGKRVFRARDCSVIACSDCVLEPSYMYRNCWIKPLPRERLLAELVRHKNHLQTVALLCDEQDRDVLESVLAKTGIVRITNGRNMSKSYCGIPHDGEFPLRRYMKVVSYEY
jgi:hypothetical protein